MGEENGADDGEEEEDVEEKKAKKKKMVRAKKKRREMTNVTHPISRHISYTKYTTSSSSLNRYSAAVVPAPETNLITGAFTRCFLIPPPFSEFEVVATPKHQLPTPNERRKNFT